MNRSDSNSRLAGCRTLFAGAYEVLSALSMAADNGRAGRDLTELAELRADDRVVDIGCGPGAAARVAARRCSRVTGVDPSQVMLRLGRWLAVLGRSRNVVFVEGTAESLPLPDESVTVVWALRSFHHWTDRAAGISEAHRVLAPGGRVIIAERLIKPGARGRGAHGLSSVQADRLAYGLRATGFSDVRQLRKGAGRQTMLITLGLRCIGD